MSSIRPTVLIVDPFSSGAQFSERIKQKYGYNCLALITNTKLPQLLLSGLRKTDFTEIFTLNDSIDEMIIEIERVLGGPPEYIVCGSEPGVLVFDVLSNCWNLSPNDVKKSRARRDKYLMMEQLRNDGICHIPSFKSSSIDQILEWIKTQKLTDIVVKPIMSFGTEGVHFCHNENEIRTACENLLGKVDYSGNINQEVLVQKLIYGDEYVVDVVSSNGLHHVVNMFKYTKQATSSKSR
ncbi:ATP-grasp domain-containing protein [Fastidiosibacter lacustris]|uniref:ATP-grasp domain-containing protein n=1 Tax=Fastidiosibacter lacustris TaxID=2056695 RepID=UPI000E34B3EA|nr:ATP-grasp domain-containing protein [Fastidiosibacter lacustris]